MLPAQAILDTTKASFAMEGMYATDYDEKNIMDVLTGNRSLEDVIKEIKKKLLQRRNRKWTSIITSTRMMEM